MGSESNASRLRDLVLLARGKSPGGKGGKAANPIVSEENENPGEKSDGALPFVDVAQLRGLAGMTLELYRKLAPFLTVYARDGRINPLAAPEQVLAAIPNLTPTDIEKLRSLSGLPKKDDPAISDIARRAGDYLADEPGPAFLVTVAVLNPGARHATGRVYVMAPGMDANAPYRLIAKRPVQSLQLDGVRQATSR
jgi:general secretion pathway protein K